VLIIMCPNSCTRTFFAKCDFGVVATVQGNGSEAYPEGGEPACVAIDCYRGDECGQGSGGVCPLANLSLRDPHALMPQTYEGGPLTVECKGGTGAISSTAPFASCSDPPAHTYSCNDCRWASAGGRGCRPRICDELNTAGVARVYPEDSTLGWPPRLLTGRSVTVECSEVLYLVLLLYHHPWVTKEPILGVALGANVKGHVACRGRRCDHDCEDASLEVRATWGCDVS